jgi:hypothetical protein
MFVMYVLNRNIFHLFLLMFIQKFDKSSFFLYIMYCIKFKINEFVNISFKVFVCMC